MFAVYNLNSHLDKAAYSIEISAENNKNTCDIQSDSDAHEMKTQIMFLNSSA